MNYKRNILMIIISITVLLSLVACSQEMQNNDLPSNTTNNVSNNLVSISKIFNQSDIFTERDLEQTPDLSNATKLEITDNTDITIDKEGIYVISGTAKNATINVSVTDEEKVQLVLDNLNISNTDKECIHVESADKVFVTINSQSSLNYLVTDAENATGAILSRSDIAFNGSGILNINSENNGIVGKDDLKITGGTYNITASKNAIRANDSIRIAGGTFNLKAGSDGLHAENNDDDTKGYIYINACTLNIEAGDDAIHATSVLQIDGGTFAIKSAEGLEGTYIQINDGTITIEASDDGINAANKSSAYTPIIEINGGNIKIDMGRGDTDGIDSNGSIVINGGTIDVTGSSTFDYDTKAEFNGGKIIINGEEVSTIPNQFMGGGMMRGGENGKNRNFDMNGEFGDFEKGTPPADFSGDFGGRMRRQDMSGDANFQDKMPMNGFRKDK